MLVGITGGFCCGKSTFLHIMHRLGFETYSADEMVDKLYKKQEMIELIGHEFGETIVSTGAIDKDLLGTIVFSDDKKLRRLDGIVHPHIKRGIMEIVHKGKIVFAEVPLLFEADMETMFDKIILLSCDLKIAVERAQRRGFTEREYKERNKFQWRDEKKKNRVDYIVYTNEPMTALIEKAESVAEKLKGELK